METKIFPDIVLTLDVDWAPDFVIEYAAELFIKNNLRSTWFATHPSPAVTKLLRDKENFEIGIHPNFLPPSTHGKNEAEVLSYFKENFPGAVSMRTHGLFQGNALLGKIVETLNIKYDSSIFLPHTSHIQPVEFRISGKTLSRLPYFWGDYYFFSTGNGPMRLDSIPNLFTPGLKIFNFHPIHLFLNTKDVDGYNTAKKYLNDPSEIQRYRNTTGNGNGTLDLFNELVEMLKQRNKQTVTIHELIHIKMH